MILVHATVLNVHFPLRKLILSVTLWEENPGR